MPSVIYDWDPIEDNVAAEYDTACTLIADYTTEPGHFGDVIAQHRDGETNCFYSDGLGSTTEVTDEDNNVVATRAYSAFGETTEQSGAVELPFQWIGQKGYCFDPVQNDVYVRRRAYSASESRWKSPDPVIFNLVALYQYGKSNPLNRCDPSGLADLIFNPGSIEGMPWEVADLPGDTLGRTVVTSNILLYCDPCCRDKEWRPRLEFEVDIIIQIDIKKLQRILRDEGEVLDPSGKPYSLATIYGHEQLHVANIRKMFETATDWQTDLEFNSKCARGFDCQCVSAAQCRIDVESAAKAWKLSLQAGVAEEVGHVLNPRPASGVGYAPIGGVFPEMPVGPVPIGSVPPPWVPPILTPRIPRNPPSREF